MPHLMNTNSLDTPKELLVPASCKGCAHSDVARLIMRINIHAMRGDERGFVASNVQPIALPGIRSRYHEGYGLSRETAIADLAEFLGIPAASFEINFEGS